MTSTTNSDIINNINTKLNANGAFTPNPMDPQRYNAMKNKLEKNGCPVIATLSDSDEERYLKWMNAEAMSDEYGIIHLGQIPSASAFFEEIIHFTQIKKYGVIKSDDLTERAAREVAANRKLLHHYKVYGLNNDDLKDIEYNLATWEKDFEKRVGMTYDEADIKREI